MVLVNHPISAPAYLRAMEINRTFEGKSEAAFVDKILIECEISAQQFPFDQIDKVVNIDSDFVLVECKTFDDYGETDGSIFYWYEVPIDEPWDLQEGD